MRHAYRRWAELGYAGPLDASRHAFAAGWMLNAFLFFLLALAC